VKIIVASDHVGFPLKERLVEHLSLLGADFTDAGPADSQNPVDYPDYAERVARGVSSSVFDRGILVCGTGQGMAIAANRFPGIRAALCYSLKMADQSRAHNDANVLCLGSEELATDDALQIVDHWLKADFDGGRHALRLSKVESAVSPRHGTLISDSPGNWGGRFRFSCAISPTPSVFSPLLFAGRLNEGLRRASECGFDAVEISLCSAADLQPEILAADLSEYGLRVSAIATGRMCLEDALCLSNPSTAVLAQVKDRLFSLIALAGSLKASVIIGGVRGKLGGTLSEQKEQRLKAVSILRDCAALASDSGVAICLEPLNRYETNFVNTAQDGLALIDEIDSPSMKLLLDTFHLNIEEADMFAAVLSAGPKLGYVHLADNNRLAPGQGSINFARLLRVLRSVGYSGYLSAEILPLPDDDAAIRQVSTHLRSILSASDM
jgi:RpiB/LacA/LacB family sugar-phosphate isomerase